MQEISAGGVVFRRIRGKVELLLIEDFHLPRAANVRTVRRTIRQLQERSVRVQTRGLYQDIGPSISHKAWIVGLHLEYKTYSEIARTTRHSTASIKRYIMDFARVVLCSQRGLSLPETAYIASISERLAREYPGLYLRYNGPEYAERIQDLIVKVGPETAREEQKGGPEISCKWVII